MYSHFVYQPLFNSDLTVEYLVKYILFRFDEVWCIFYLVLVNHNHLILLFSIITAVLEPIS